MFYCYWDNFNLFLSGFEHGFWACSDPKIKIHVSLHWQGSVWSTVSPYYSPAPEACRNKLVFHFCWFTIFVEYLDSCWTCKSHNDLWLPSFCHYENSRTPSWMYIWKTPAAFFFFNWLLWPVKIISLMLRWVKHKVGWKQEILRKTTWPPASRTWIVSHVTPARLEPTAER